MSPQAAHCVLAQNPENVELARFYCFTQKTIARRLVLRQCERVKDGYISLMQLHAAACLTERDPSVKRTLCKRCCTLLVPGVTGTTRQKRKQRKTGFTVVRCLSCGQTKSFQNNPDHCLWVERPEAQLEQQEQQGGCSTALSCL
ncbi:Ribonuclease P protein subunit p21 [Oryzias melastigma]|uniref:Ribonuclease P protein subunit p21 n=1 Tax=Oryzias melastigma TaxID=30732 RepID=A0A834FAY9_ORYME|nr:Ribonuclease P protein subunit p21 [Oryzias melastigma]